MTAEPIPEDERLALVLEELTDAAQRGDDLAPQRIADAQPSLAPAVWELWGALMITGAAANGATVRWQRDSVQTAQAPAEFELPHQMGDYELLEEVGRGGMGIVYRARQSSLRREVAVKVILRGAVASPQDRSRFRSEAEAAARLDHPGVVSIYEVGEHDGQLYFSMPMVRGQTLAARLQLGPLAEAEAARIVAAVARAIQYAHERGIVHRDLKPANILLDAAGEPHVSDFGLAKRLEPSSSATLTQAGAIMGTPSFMAPEQASGGRGDIGPWTDVYSLGALLYAAVTGRPPHQGPSPVDTLISLLEQEPPAPRLLNGRVTRDLEMVILRCLQKPADLRYASAAEVADDLDALLCGEPVSARSGRFSQVVSRVFRETSHAALLENWGLLWMWHSLVLLVICLATNAMHALRHSVPAMAQPWPYLLLWGGGLSIWAPIFWKLRHRSGPVTAIERQIAHLWGSSVVGVVLLFVIEGLLGLEVLTLSPVLAVISGMVFAVKAGMLAGSFYVQSAALFATALVMAKMQREGLDLSVTLFGVVAAAAFFVPGLKYYLQRRRLGRRSRGGGEANP
ncbi:Serine/threonine-protein kinase PrkC [Pirellulimonas nuda]|uniref:non-specific serine/threonine protein kinase n=1 Tax=Pirellulimonas nuda TaxID=2528009 RepID=A0A518DJW0_9BACT|nr:serine/threonine-protein kinase [Pirellulimonas nuda]QDU91736.1 Serine/threonine-protein kinase PrkC [Pirellulimonas nuda]